MTKRNTWNDRKLSDFFKPSKPLNLNVPPLYDYAKTGQIISIDEDHAEQVFKKLRLIDEPARRSL